MTTHAPRWRKGSVYACQFRPLDRNDLARILFLAEALDRNTHQPGKHGGIIGRSGLAVLRALITRFFNKRSGRLDPSLAAIAKAANLARSTVQDAIDRLEIAGIIERIRRVFRTRVTLQCELTGQTYTADRVLQDTNAYLLNVPLPDRADYGSLSTPRKRHDFSDTGSRSGTSDLFTYSSALPHPTLLEPLATALERLQTAMIARKATP